MAVPFPIPYAAVSFLVDNISEALSYNYKMIANVKVNMDTLQRELVTLRNLMKDFQEYNINEKGMYIQGTVERITNVIAQAEDAVDTCLLYATVQNSRSWLSKAFHGITDYPLALRQVSKQIEEINREVTKIKEENTNNVFQLLQCPANRNHRPPKQAPTVEEDHVVGFEGAADAVGKLLTEGPEQFQVISIVGMLGLGKTTLAKKVLKDPKVDFQYRTRAFVYVSREYEKKEVYHKILTSFARTSTDPEAVMNKMSEDELEEHLHKELSGKEYLIVLDDVWEKHDWDRLKGAFPKNSNKRCRVLITTRNEEVAKHANKKFPSYKLNFLSRESSRELLRWKVFEDSDFPLELQEHEIEIAAKCDGLPLAIVVISGILCNEPESVQWWKHVADSVKDYIARDVNESTKVIGLMYKHLPNHLKRCFLYMGVFREDFEIPVWKLVRLWIAEGLIQQERDFILEDIAQRNLNELVYRNLVMVGQRTSNDRIKTCRMHDTLREFCKEEATKENLFQEIKKEKLPFFLSKKEDLDRYRRLCINNANVVQDYISSRTLSGNCVRSFLTFNKDKTAIDQRWVNSIPKTFKLLKVLEMEALVYSYFPDKISHLVLLKYVAVSSNFTNIPAVMKSMWHLQTLIVNTTHSTLQIEANIWEMPQLRHLHTNASTILPRPPPDHVGTSSTTTTKAAAATTETLIQTLSTISPESCGNEVFVRTPKIKKLGIRGAALARLFESSSLVLGNLGSLRYLENLKLLNDNVTLKIGAFPSHVSFPQQITKLTLLNTRLGWEEMSRLGKLERLEVLKLRDNAFEGQLWETETGGFRLLKHLHIGRTDLKVWEKASVEHFPKLKCLRLFNCDNLKAVPDGLADIASLQLLILNCTNTSVASSARRLHVLKLQEAQRHNSTNTTFRLSIYPPDH